MNSPFTSGFIWPQVFLTGQLPERKDQSERNYKLLLVAEALEGWALCHVDRAPESFGVGMAEIGQYLDIVAGPDQLKQLADQLMKEKP